MGKRYKLLLEISSEFNTPRAFDRKLSAVESLLHREAGTAAMTLFTGPASGRDTGIAEILYKSEGMDVDALMSFIGSEMENESGLFGSGSSVNKSGITAGHVLTCDTEHLPGSVVAYSLAPPDETGRYLCFFLEGEDVPDDLVEQVFDPAAGIIGTAWEHDRAIRKKVSPFSSDCTNDELVERTTRMASIGVVAAGITHEINQPLTAVKLNVDGILYWNKKNAGVLPEYFVGKLRDISSGVDRINEIVSHLRRLWIEGCEHDWEEVDLNGVLDEALMMVTRQMYSHGIEPETHMYGEPLMVRGVPVYLEQVVMNIVVNAIQSLDTVQQAHKHIAITTTREDDRAVMTVEDNAPDMAERQTGKEGVPIVPDTAQSQCLSLGCAIAERFVREHKGTIRAERREETNRVIITLPLIS